MAVLFSIIGRDGDLDLALNYLWFTPPEESRAKLYKGMNKTWRQQNAYLLINNKPQTCYKRLFIRERK